MIREMNVVPIETGFAIYFKTVGNNREYEQRIELSEGEMVKWSCDCKWGSCWRFTKNNQEQDKKCRHIIQNLELLNYLGYLKNGT